MKHIVNLADTSFTVELGPETIKVFNSISWQLKRLADAWEGTKKEDGKTTLTPAQIAVRSKNASSKSWTPEEDERLLKMVELLGMNWVTIHKTNKFPGRIPSAISSRYHNELKNKE